jgi:hypothetical protein
MAVAVEDPIIVLGVLIIVLGGDPLARHIGVSGERQISLQNPCSRTPVLTVRAAAGMVGVSSV